MVPSPALFPALLGQHWHALAAPVRRMHGEEAWVRARGSVRVEGAGHLPARVLRRWLGLPEPGAGQALEVTIERHAGHEIWTRRFASGCMRSRLAASPDRLRLHERLGPVTLRFELCRAGDAIDWRLCGGRLLGLPLPRAWLGSVLSRSGAQGGRYAFRIDTRLPLLGRLVAYRGWLEVVDE
ncbi:DUF4166 domain-containing protein [Frateuria sp. STR12]|nr:DUF4166 domain-containing protein [Frateuria sp. STR12]MCX7512671.1 DUF4166 domain-containing protein [Frateuria sp. STR12]